MPNHMMLAALSKAPRSAVALLCVAAQVAGCARSPDSIDAKYVSPNMYQSWTCDQLVEEKRRLTSEVDRVSGLQRENANADAAMMTVGVVLLWPVLLGLAATKDRKDELGRLKGEYEAVDYSTKSKQCSMPAPGVPSVPVQPSVETASMVAAAAGVYKGRGTADSWCQTPSMDVTLAGNSFQGYLSETPTGAPTSKVTGTLFPTGIVTLEFKGDREGYFTGKVDGTLTNNVLSIRWRTTAAQACSYQFELSRI